MNLEELFNPKKLPIVNPTKQDAIVEFMSKNCSDIITVYKDAKSVFYRGLIYGSPKDIFIADTPKIRKTIDSEKIASKIFDDALQATGFNALRKNSIFVTSSMYNTKMYTNPKRLSMDHIPRNVFAIFPINGFDYTWNVNESDLIIKMRILCRICDLEEYYDSTEEIIKIFYKNGKIKDEYAEEIIRYYGTIKEDLLSAIYKQYEVWIHGKYIGVRTDNPIFYKLLGFQA